jgi:hypothetical protein
VCYDNVPSCSTRIHNNEATMKNEGNIVRGFIVHRISKLLNNLTFPTN